MMEMKEFLDSLTAKEAADILKQLRDTKAQGRKSLMPKRITITHNCRLCGASYDREEEVITNANELKSLSIKQCSCPYCRTRLQEWSKDELIAELIHIAGKGFDALPRRY